ncbi:esterase FE4-like isoform X2 [Pectinophora gossypiella]|nr:esterase FE4-like isoform X2 [Pectinophora gossypiella]
MTCIVNVEQGSLQGKECTTYNGRKYYSFEGIPYAKPPVAKLRFRDPQPAESWTGIRDATKPGNKCAQMDPYGKNALIGSEDCLYLNIYTPSLPQEKIENLPVIFFVHGGRFLVGYGDYYQPDYFLQNDVILVTINYRLHILGFLCLHIPEAPGNAAFKDTIMALRWVKKNIKYFNGDENNVTAFGESAGAGLVTSYVTTKMADGLVNKIIGQSGVCISDLLLIEDDPVEKARHIASILGRDLKDEKSLYEFLVNAPIEELIFAAGVAELSRPPHIISAYFLPNVEKKLEGVEPFFEEYPIATLKQNRYLKIPMLFGLNSHEGALFLRRDSEGKIQYLTDPAKFIPRYLSIPENSPRAVNFGKQLKQFYFKNKEINEETKEEYIDFISDSYFNRDIVMFAEYYSKYCDNVYFYNFCYAGNMNTRVMKQLGLKGASHGDIVQYQFYKKNKADLCDEKDKAIIKFICEAWCNFAKNGKPTWSDQKVEWQPYDQAKRLCLNIDNNLSLVQYPGWKRIKFWIDNMGERSKL